MQAPAQFQTTVRASAANLKAGTYAATITFIGLESNTTQALKVTFTVKAGCLRAAPTTLAFQTTQGSNPASQSIAMTNCGLTSDWLAAATSDKGWLSISPSKGTLKGGGSGTITASVNSSGLQPGSYSGSVTIKLGSQSATITVSLTVAGPPSITASPNPVNPDCAIDANGNTDCTVTLTNSSSILVLNWSVSVNQSGVTVQPGSGFTIPAGGQETVTIVFSICTDTIVTFIGPLNSATVTWNCTPVE